MNPKSVPHSSVLHFKTVKIQTHEPVRSSSSRTATLKKYWQNLCIFTAFVFGCMYQVHHICDVFYAYPTKVAVTVEMSKEFELPAFTFCTQMSNALNQSEINKHLPSM